MAERILCDEGVRVSVSGAGERVLVAVKGSYTVRFWTAASDLHEAIRDQAPLQLSVHGGYCRLDVRGERTHLEFALDGSGRKTCDFPTKDLINALHMVRNQRPEDEAIDGIHVEPA